MQQDQSNIPNLAIFASGRGSNCLAILRAVHEGRLHARVAVVVSDVPDAAVLAAAREWGAEAIYQDPGRRGARLAEVAEKEYVRVLKDHGVEWIALAGFMRILGEPLLTGFPGRILNIHPSLLPAFPGLDGPGQAWRTGVKVAGCTVHFVDAGVDTGPIVAQQAVDVLDDDTEDTLRSRILAAEHATYIRALEAVLSGAYTLNGRRVIKSAPAVPFKENS